MTEHSVLSERVKTLESLLIDSGAITRETLEAFEPSEAQDAEWGQDRFKLIKDVLESGANITEQQKEDYKAALSFFGSGKETVERATDQSKHCDGVVASSQPTTSAIKETVEWHHHTDGYHYKKLPNGSFDPLAYVRSEDGTYTPYS